VDENFLSERFCDLWQRCGGEIAPAVWQKIRSHYQEPNRHYHTLGHIGHCMTQLDVARAHIQEFDATEMAIWWHDVIYHYGAKDNEILSAAYFRDFAAASMPVSFVERVCEFIIATQHTGAAGDAATAFVVDIDLSGFGRPWDGYLADSTALRLEAHEVTDECYYNGKLRFLSELQSWPSLYQSAFFRDRLEANAQANITRYTGDLRKQGFGEFAICRAL
jgi:predicted metal-dependent HD superfamily phosphohydrolase